MLSAAYSAYSCLIPGLFLRYFWILAFCSIFCLLLAYCCLIRSLYYSCLIRALFLYVCFLHPYFAYSWFFSAYFLFAYLCEIYLLHFGSKQQTENSYIFVVGDYFDRLEPCSEISPVCHPWDWWCSILFLLVSSLMVQIFSARNVFQRTVPMTWIMNNLKLWVFWNNDHLKLIRGLFLPYFLMMTDFQNNPGISNYGGGGYLGGGCFGSHDIPWIDWQESAHLKNAAALHIGQVYANFPHSAKTKIQHEVQNSWSLEWRVKYFNGSSRLEAYKNENGVISQLVKGQVGVISRLVTD